MSESKVSKEKFAEVVESVQLVDVFSKSLSANVDVYPSTIDPINTTLGIDNTVTYELTEKHLFCFIKTTVKGTSTEGSADQKKGSTLFGINTEVVLTYELEKSDLDSAAIELFASRNALYNGFPFIRELLLSFSTRLAIPPVLLPLSKPPKPKKKTEVPIDKQL